MSSANIFFQPAHKVYSSAVQMKEGLRPAYNKMTNSLWVSDIGPQIAVHLHGMQRPERYKNFLNLYSPDMLKYSSAIWAELEKAIGKLGETCGDFKAIIFGGKEFSPLEPQNANSQDLFYEILERFYKNNYDYSAIGLTQSGAADDNIYISGNNTYIYNDEISEIIPEKNMTDITPEEVVSRLKDRRYGFIEISPNHTVKIGEQLRGFMANRV